MIMRKKDQGNTEDDDRLWENFTSQINPLKSVRHSSAADEILGGRKRYFKPKILGRVSKIGAAKNSAKSGKIEPIDLREGDHAGLDKKTRQKLLRGNQTVDARIDLHGHNAQQAEIRLRAFIQKSASVGHRCVLVITGKGVRGEGVLRRHVPLWLKQPPLDSIVLAISNAIPKDGGTGAVYVMLRRNRTPK